VVHVRYMHTRFLEGGVHSSIPLRFLRSVAWAAVVATVAQTHVAAAASVSALVQVSGPSPFSRCTAGRTSGQPSTNVNYDNSAVEPSVAVNAQTVGTDHVNLVGAWQQDRWSTGAARGLVARAVCLAVVRAARPVDRAERVVRRADARARCPLVLAAFRLLEREPTMYGRTLLRLSVLAMYAARKRGRSVFRADPAQRQRLYEQVFLEQETADAELTSLADGEVVASAEYELDW